MHKNDKKWYLQYLQVRAQACAKLRITTDAAQEAQQLIIHRFSLNQRSNNQ